MENTGGGAVKRIFVKVFGFSDVERHALNTVFRLSELRPVAYALWTPDAPQKAQVALVDGESWEATVEFANPENHTLDLVWVGERPAASARLVVARPLQWSAVLEGVDGLYAAEVMAGLRPSDVAAAPELDFDISAPAGLDIDFDLDLVASPSANQDGGDAHVTTAPAPLEAGAAQQGERVLLVEPDRDTRLYVRAKLANAGLLLIDEAVTGAEALAFLQAQAYFLALVDMDVADKGAQDVDVWKLVRAARRGAMPVGHIVLMRDQLSRIDMVRAWFAGIRISLAKPLHPRDLKQMLRDIGRPLR